MDKKTEVLSTIKQAEEKAVQMIAAAQQEKEELLARVAQETKEWERHELDMLAEEQKAALEKAQPRDDKTPADAIEARKVRNAAEKHAEKALQIVLDEFERQFL